MSEKQDTVLMVTTHARSSKFAGKIYNSAAIGALIDNIARENEVVSICRGEFDLVKQFNH